MIAPEGKIILIPLILCLLAGVGIHIFYHIQKLKWVNVALFVLTLFSLYFFRDPQRLPVGGIQVMVSPADGKIVQIIPVDDPDIGPATQISIFLSVFNVHCQRVPINAKVISTHYNKGKFLAAFKDKASMENEQSSTIFETNGERFKIKQIAGLIARRIVNYMVPEASVQKGQRLGFIRFGSRVDIIVPQHFSIDVSLGDIVQGNLSKIGTFH